jgi:hypothetical protein
MKWDMMKVVMVYFEVLSQKFAKMNRAKPQKPVWNTSYYIGTLRMG